MADNKVKFGLKHVHVAELIEGEDGAYTFGTPKAIAGAVNLTTDPQGESTPFYADNTVYYTSVSNTGYDGTLEMALIPDWFMIEYLGCAKSDKGLLVEDANVQGKPFALLYEFEGDSKATKHIFYNCLATRPSNEDSTTEDTIEVKTQTLNFSAKPLTVEGHAFVKAKSMSDTDSATYEAWYTKAPAIPTFTAVTSETAQG